MRIETIGKAGVLAAILIVVYAVGSQDRSMQPLPMVAPAAATPPRSEPAGADMTGLPKFMHINVEAQRYLEYMPADQEVFAGVILISRARFEAADNDMARGRERANRRARICNALESSKVKGWVGRVTELSSNSAGKGVLGLDMAWPIAFTTSNNALSDIGSNTLIDPHSALADQAVRLKKGQWVRFSGEFFPDATDCVWEQSLTQMGSMTSPSFIFRFSSVSPID